MAEEMSHRSSLIAHTSYAHFDEADADAKAGDLIVEFTDGKRIVYHDVPRGVYTAFITSSSKGRAWHALLKDGYDWEEV